MGVDYSAVLMVGKAFNEESDAVDWLESKGVEFAEDDLEDGLADYLDSNKNKLAITGTILNMYTGYGFVLGYYLTLHDPANFGQQYQEMFDKFKSTFNIDPDLISEVLVW